MKIIINPKLRKLKKELDYFNLEYQDYMLDKRLLNVSDPVSFLDSLQNIPLNKEQFSFLASLYDDNQELFYKLKKLLGSNYGLSQNEINLYQEEKDIYEKLVDIKINNTNIDSLNQEFIDMWGEDFVKENYNIIRMFNYDDIKEYADVLKSNPTRLKEIVPLLDSSNKKYLKQLLALPSDADIKDIVNNLKLLKDDYLIKSYLENYNDEDYKTIVEKVVNNYKGTAPLGEKMELTAIQSKKLFYSYIANGNVNNNELRDYALRILSNRNIDYFKFYNVLEDAIGKGYPIPEDVEHFCKYCEEIYSDQKTKEEILKDAYDSIYSDGINFDANEIITTVKQFKSHELSQNIIDPQKEKINHYEEYSYVDEKGNQVTKQIPVIKIDDPNFNAIVHSIVKKDENTSPNYEISQKLVDNPEMWGKIKGGNPNISMSYMHNYFSAFGKRNGVVLGFNEVTPDRLIGTYNGDGATTMVDKTDETAQFVPLETMTQTENKYGLNNGWGYNEILTRRFVDDEIVKPDYIMIASGLENTHDIELAKKWAVHFDIPIVEIDMKKIKEYHVDKYQTMLEEIKNTHNIKDYDVIDKLYEEVALIQNCSDDLYDYTNPTLFDAFHTITQNIDMNNYNNAKCINELLNRIDIASNNPNWFEIGYDTTINPTTKNYNDPRLTSEKVEVMQQYVTAIRYKCNQVINANEMEITSGKAR